MTYYSSEKHKTETNMRTQSCCTFRLPFPWAYPRNYGLRLFHQPVRWKLPTMSVMHTPACEVAPHWTAFAYTIHIFLFLLSVAYKVARAGVNKRVPPFPPRFIDEAGRNIIIASYLSYFWLVDRVRTVFTVYTFSVKQDVRCNARRTQDLPAVHQLSLLVIAVLKKHRPKSSTEEASNIL